jgi:tRNA(fMet)-specific endonuclease VapC
MTIYVFDTDHLSLYARSHPPLIARLNSSQISLVTTAVNAEEQVRGRLAQVSVAKDGSQLIAYQLFIETLELLSDFQIFPYSKQSYQIYQSLKSQKIRVGTQDLKIASIAMSSSAILLTRNLQDFEKIPGLIVQNWSA